MTADQLPRDVYLFIRAHIRTVLQLEMLLLLQAHADEWWTAEAANRQHHASVDAAHQYLQALCDAKLLERTSDADPKFRFAPEREQDAATVATIAGLFRTHYYSLVDTIYESRRGDIQAFADAFKLGKKGGSDG